MNAPFSHRVLRCCQERAATWLYEHDAAFLIAPLGAGKDAAALTADLVRDKHRRHALVIAPKLFRRAFGAVPALGDPTPAHEAARLVAAWNEEALTLRAFHPASAGMGSICSTAGRP